MRKTFQYRLYPNKAQEQTLLFWLRRCCALYNACLEESKAAWTMQGKSLSAFDQINELPDLKQAFPAYQELPSHVLRGGDSSPFQSEAGVLSPGRCGNQARVPALQDDRSLPQSDLSRSGG